MLDVQLQVGTFTRSILLHVARADGSLAKSGIAVEESTVNSSPGQFESLEAGEFDVIFTSPDNVLAYRFLSNNPLGRNLPVEVLGALDRGLGLSLCFGPDVHSAEQLRGQVVGVDVPQSGFAFIAYELLDRAGLHPGDYHVVSLGSTPRRAAALIAGECAATVLNAGNELRAQGVGCTIASSVTDVGPYLGTVVAALATDDSDIKEARKQFTAVMLDTARAIVAGQRDGEVMDAASELLGLSPEQARAHLICLKEPSTGLVVDGTVDTASLETLIELRRRYLPATELDSIVPSMPSFIVERARP